MAESRKPEIELGGVKEVKKDIADVEDDPNKLPEAPLASRMPAVKWDVMKSKIDNYEMKSKSKELLDSKQSADKVRELLENNDQALKALYKLPVTERIRGAFKKDKDNPTKDREKLITEMQKRFRSLDNITPDSLGSRPPIQLEAFLGKKIFKLYKKAIEEESKSQAFRNAVFLQSTEHHAGAKWDERLVLWIGGQSGSGKSHVVPAMIAKIAADIMSSSADQSGNDVVTIDGGKGREVSQMYQIVLQVAIRNGYKGIDDLDKKTKLDVKGKVKNAALKTKSLNIVIPDTFVRKFILALKNISILRGVFNKYAEMQNTKQVFAEVTGGKDKEGQERFKRTVAFQGNSRAWFQNTRKNLEKVWNVIINNRNIGVESKKYHAEYFEAGGEATEAARKAYIQAQQKQGKTVYCLTCTNDRMYVYYSKDDKAWKECGDNYTGDDPIGLSYRAFQAWKEIEQGKADPEEAFKAWIKDPVGGDQEKFTSALIDITKEKPDFKPIADEKLSESNNFNIITLADVEKYLTSHPVADIEYRKDGMDGKELYKLIKEIGKSDLGILEHFKNAYIYIKEKENSGANSPGEYGALYKKVSDGATYLFKQDTTYEYVKAIKRERFGQPPKHHVAKDISEFVATKMGASIYDGVAPEMVVKLHPAQKSPYIGSKYFGGGAGEKYVDLFKDVYQNYYRVPQLKNLLAELSKENVVYDYNALKKAYLDEEKDRDSKYIDPNYLAFIDGLSFARSKDEAINDIESYLKALEKNVSALEKRPKVLGLKQFLGHKEGDIFKHAVSRRKEDKKDGELIYKGIEKALVLSALFADNDVHSGNIGVVIDAKGNRDCKRIDFGAALAKEYFNVERGLKLGSEQRAQFFTASPTNHFTEYPKSVVYTEDFAKAIDECVANFNMNMAEQLKLFDNPEFNLWPMEDRLKFASYIGIPKPDPTNLNDQIQKHMKSVLDLRLLSLETYALNIRLSLCFKKDEKGKFILDPDKESELKKLIIENKDKDIFKGFFEEDKEFEGGKIKLRSPETKSPKAKADFRDKVKEMYYEVVEETPRRAEVRAPEGLDEKTIREKAAFNRAHESDLARLDLKHDDEWKTTKKVKPDASSHMEGKMPKGFEKVQEKTVFSKKTTITEESKAKASFTERCEADGRLTIIATSPPEVLVDYRGMPTWKCLQYVKDQIREILKAFPPPGKPIIEVHDERFLKAYALICRQNNIPFKNMAGGENPDLYVVPADYDLAYKLKITPSLATSVSEFFTERSSRENTVAREISLNINSIKETLRSTSEDKDKDMVTHSKFVTDSTLLGKILETPRLTDAQREDITKLKADLDRRIDHFKYPSLKR